MEEVGAEYGARTRRARRGSTRDSADSDADVDTTWLTIQDNLVVQWGIQDNYEIVRKVGRGKYSEVS